VFSVSPRRSSSPEKINSAVARIRRPPVHTASQRTVCRVSYPFTTDVLMGGEMQEQATYAFERNIRDLSLAESRVLRPQNRTPALHGRHPSWI